MNLIDIFLKGVQNDVTAGNVHSKKQKLNMFLFYILALFLSKKNQIKHNTLAFINGKRGYERLLPVEKDIYYVFHGTFFKQWSNFRRYNSAFSAMNFKDRIGITFHCLKTYFLNKSQINSLALWMEFYLLYSLLIKYQPSVIITPGFADRQTTWIAFICSSQKIKLEVYQHGILYNEELRHKISCSKIYAFDQLQIELFKEYMIANSDCEYAIIGFKSVLQFSDFEKAGKVLIGVATQRNPEVIHKIMENLLCIQNDFIILIMVHPSENVSNYDRYIGNNRVVIEPKQRYLNLDLLITQNSTIAYDYLSSGFGGKIFRIDPSGLICVLDNIKEIVYIKKYEEIKGIIGNYINNIGDEKC